MGLKPFRIFAKLTTFAPCFASSLVAKDDAVGVCGRYVNDLKVKGGDAVSVFDFGCEANMNC
jgi:hypothetical protein